MSVKVDDDEILGKAYDAELVRRLGTFLTPYWRPIALATALMFLGAAVELTPPLLVRQAIDGPIAARDPAGVLPIFGLYVLALLGSFGFRYGQTYIMNSVGQRVMVDIRLRIFGHIQKMSLGFFDKNPVGRLITRISNDVDALNEFITQGTVALLGDLVRLVLIAITMLVLNWRLALISLMMFPVIIVATSVFQRIQRQVYRQVRQRIARINAFLNEQITGILVTQLFGREERSRMRFRELSQEYLAAQLRSNQTFAIFFPLVSFISVMATALLLNLGGQVVLADLATLGMLVAFIQYTDQAFQPIRQIAERYNTLQAAMASSERVFGVLDTPEGITDPLVPKHLVQPVRGEIRFENVWFTYNPPKETALRVERSGDPLRVERSGVDGTALRVERSGVDGTALRVERSGVDRVGDNEPHPHTPTLNAQRTIAERDIEWVLRGISFTIPAGQSVAVVGATGAGKTSLVSLMARFYDIQQGAITLDGVDIREVKQTELRRHVSAVPQDPVCFSGTVASNIRLHDEEISDEQVRWAAEVANAAPFIERLPGQYEYEVRERGSNLSVGQRQLLAFARAIAFNPEVLLILDEATSSVDTETEALMQTALERLMQGRTSIVIAHRLSTIRNVNRILVLHKGKLVEDGTHEELLAKRGYYHRLYQLQFAEQVSA